MPATRPSFADGRSYNFSDASLRQAVAHMMMDTVAPTALGSPPPALPARGQQLIAALHSISSIEELNEYEEDLRATLASREVSARGRLERLHVAEECTLEQSHLLLLAERRVRSAIANEYTVSVAVPQALVSLAATEEHARLELCLEYRAHVRQARRIAAPLRLQLLESRERMHLEAVEFLLQDELKRRRYMEIGEHAQFTQLCVDYQQLQRCAWKYSVSFLTSLRRLLAAEAADRDSLELMFLFHMATLTTQEKEARAVSLQESVDWINKNSSANPQKRRIMQA